MGYHTDGSIIVVSHTHVLRRPISRRLPDVIIVVNTIVELKRYKILTFDYKIIEGGLEQFVIDGNKVILSEDIRVDDVEFEENEV
eukprot:Gb_33838 [translate_table: standard]